MADRAYVTVLDENAAKIITYHDGYKKKFDILHTREWEFHINKIIIKDSLNKNAEAVVRLHFHPDVTEER